MDTGPLFLVLIYYPRSGNACFRQHYFKQREPPVFKQTNQSILTDKKREKEKKRKRKNSNRKKRTREWKRGTIRKVNDRTLYVYIHTRTRSKSIV